MSNYETMRTRMIERLEELDDQLKYLYTCPDIPEIEGDRNDVMVMEEIFDATVSRIKLLLAEKAGLLHTLHVFRAESEQHNG
jgi:hypothetical protein